MVLGGGGVVKSSSQYINTKNTFLENYGKELTAEQRAEFNKVADEIYYHAIMDDQAVTIDSIFKNATESFNAKIKADPSLSGAIEEIQQKMAQAYEAAASEIVTFKVSDKVIPVSKSVLVSLADSIGINGKYHITDNGNAANR